MSEATEANGAAAPAATTETAPSQTEKSSETTIDPSAAARTLVQVREARKQAASKAPAGAAGASSESPKPSGADPAAGAAQGQREPTTQEALAIIREQRKIAKEKRELESRRTQLDESSKNVSRWAAAEEKAKAGDMVGAIEALGLTNEQLFEGEQSVFWKIAEKVRQANKETPDPAKIAEAAALEALAKKERERADQQKAEAERQRVEADKQIREHCQRVNDEVLAEMKKSINDYPALADKGGIPDEDIANPDYVGAAYAHKLQTDKNALNSYVQRWTERYKSANERAPSMHEITMHLVHVTSPGFADLYEMQKGKLPTAKEILDHFERQYRAELADKLKKLGKVLPVAPAPAPNGQWRTSNGSPEKPVERETAEQARERRKAALMKR